MKKIFPFIILLGLIACAEYIAPPKNQLSKEEMAAIIAELSLNEQTLFVQPKGSTEEGAYFIFKKYNISSQDFKDNYTYYLAKKEMPKILDKAQKKIIEMHPKAKEHIQQEDKLQNAERPE